MIERANLHLGSPPDHRPRPNAYASSSPIRNTASSLSGSTLGPMEAIEKLKEDFRSITERPSLTTSINTNSEEVDTFSERLSLNSPTNQHPSVVGLRDRLLREARHERQRCLEVAEAAERRRAEFRGVNHVSTQTDPVVISEAPIVTITDVSTPTSSLANSNHYSRGSARGTSPIRHVEDLNKLDDTRRSSSSALGASPFGMLSTTASNLDFTTGSLAGGSWNKEDDQAQQEALAILGGLGDAKIERAQSETRCRVLEKDLHHARALSKEHSRKQKVEEKNKEAAHQQVLCLEKELDGKEAQLEAAEKALERKEAELKQAQHKIRMLQELNMQPAMRTSGEEAALRLKLLERERQVELKDQQIAKLVTVLRQNRNFLAEDASTACGSERSMAMTVSHLSTLSAFS